MWFSQQLALEVYILNPINYFSLYILYLSQYCEYKIAAVSKTLYILAKYLHRYLQLINEFLGSNTGGRTHFLSDKMCRARDIQTPTEADQIVFFFFLYILRKGSRFRYLGTRQKSELNLWNLLKFSFFKSTSNHNKKSVDSKIQTLNLHVVKSPL